MNLKYLVFKLKPVNKHQADSGALNDLTLSVQKLKNFPIFIK